MYRGCRSPETIHFTRTSNQKYTKKYQTLNYKKDKHLIFYYCHMTYHFIFLTIAKMNNFFGYFKLSIYIP